MKKNLLIALAFVVACNIAFAQQSKEDLNNWAKQQSNGVDAGDVVNYLNGNRGVTADGTTFGAEYVFNPGVIGISSAATLDATHFVVAYKDDGNGGKGTAIVGTVDGNSITYGAEYIFNASNTTDIPVKAIDATHFIVAFNDNGNSNRASAIIGTVSGGNTIAYGSKVAYNSSYNVYTTIALLNANTFVLSYKDSDNSNFGTSIVGTVSGTSITFGDEYVFNDALSNEATTTSLDATHFVVAYQDYGNSSYGTAIVGTVSGTSISFGSETVYNSASTSTISITGLNASTFVVSSKGYDNTAQSSIGYAVLGSVTGGNAITFGDKYNFFFSNYAEVSSTTIDASNFVIALKEYSTTSGKTVVGNVSGSTMSFGPPSVFNGGDTYTTSVIHLTGNNIAVAYRDATNSHYGTAIIGTISPSADLPMLSTTPITAITDVSASSGGNMDWEGSTPVTAKGVCWSTSSGPTTADSKTTDGTGPFSFTSSITGLTFGTTYYVKAYATNGAGTSYGDEISFTTSPEATVWTGATITFSKADYANFNQEANQDRITNSTWITRDDWEGIFNIKTESYFDFNTSPENTEWATGDIADYASLTYQKFSNWAGWEPSTTIIDVDAVLHLISDNIYLSIKFTSYSYDFSGGGFSYERSTPALIVTWDGSTSTSWNEGTNWDGDAVPTAGDNVIIPDVANDPVVGTSATADCNELTINSGASLTVNSGGSLITNGDISNNGTMDVKLDITDGTWHLISVPNNVTTANTFLGDYLQTWDETTVTWTDITEPTDALTPVKGYSLWGVAKSTTHTFTGTPNTGNQSISITATGKGVSYNRANLLGNPYPSSIDWSGLNGTYGAVYYWNGTTYVSWNGSGTGSQYIPPMQGFFIVPASGGTFSLTNANRTHTGASTYYKSTENTPYNGIVLQASNGSYNDELYVLLDDEANAAFELTRDAWKFPSNTPGISQLWSVCPDGNLSIDVRPYQETIKLGFANDQAGIYSISIKEMADISTAILEDTKLNTFTDLTKGAYEFTWDITDDDTRFDLHLGVTGIETITQPEKLLIYASGQTIYLKPLEGQTAGVFTLTDMTGRQIIQKELQLSGLISVPVGLKTGVYVVTFTSDVSSYVKKVIIN